jgi:hypothetical protein
MNNPVTFGRVGRELFQVQLVWSFWYIGILLFIDIVRFTVFGMEIDTFYNQSYVATNIYMFVIGIIAINFLSYYVGNGITRKNYFLGNLVAALCLSIAIPILSYLLSMLEKLILPNVREPQLSSVPEVDSNLIGDIIQSFLITPHIDLGSSVFLSLLFFAVNIFVFYLIGWLIGVAFYRLGVLLGLLSIVVAITINIVKDSLLRIVLDLPLYPSFSMLETINPTIASIGTVLTILFTILLIYLLVRRAPIKM